MNQEELLSGSDGSQSPKIQAHPLGKGLTLEIDIRSCKLIIRNRTIKNVKRSDKVAMKLFVIEAVELGAMQTRLSIALKISRQSIHNYREIYSHFGLEGLIHGYTLVDGKSLEKQRKLHADQRGQGNKAEQVASIRAEEKAADKAQEDACQASLNFSFEENERPKEVPPTQQPFSQTHGWEETRYAGLFIYWPPLINQWRWLQLVMGHFGPAWPIFSVFLLMSGLNYRSIEQIKNIRQREAGRVLGLERLPGTTLVRSWFYDAANQERSKVLLNDYFRHQIREGLVCFRVWFTDGHLLPYTGKEKVHYSYNTQRQMPVPGRTNQVTCDSNGRIVNFVIEEGKGAMKQQILDVVEQYLPELPARPIASFDREGYDKAFFSKLVKAEQPFVTWDKNVDTTKLNAIADDQFTSQFEFNEKHYSVFEQEKTFSYLPESEKETGEKPHEKEPHIFTLRHLIIWNHASNRRTAGLAYSASESLDTAEAVQVILSRWGASENTFKHLKERHPLHYHPGFKLLDSKSQEITNPEIKEKTTLIRKLRSEIDKLLRTLNKIVEKPKKDGAPRKNSRKEKVQETINKKETEFEQLREEKKVLPEKIDVTNLEDYRSFKQIDNEGKYLFDFVTTSVWNARKQLIDWLGESYKNKNDLVDLFYAITHCHGWIRSTENEVRVRLEPLQQPRRRIAQEFLCRKLSGLGAQTPIGKLLVVEVGDSPL